MSDSGVVDQNVEPAPALGHSLEQQRDLGLAGDVDNDAFLPQFSGGGGEPLRVDIGQQHFRPFGHESCGNCLADPLRRAGDDRAFAK